MVHMHLDVHHHQPDCCMPARGGEFSTEDWWQNVPFVSDCATNPVHVEKITLVERDSSVNIHKHKAWMHTRPHAQIHMKKAARQLAFST